MQSNLDVRINYQEFYDLIVEGAANRYPHDQMSATEYIATSCYANPLLRLYYDMAQSNLCRSGLPHKHYSFWRSDGHSTEFRLPTSFDPSLASILKVGNYFFSLLISDTNPNSIRLTESSLLLPLPLRRGSIIVLSYWHE